MSLHALTLATLLVLLSACSALNPVIEVTEQELQQQIEKSMPVKEHLLFVDVILNNPKIELKEASEKISLYSEIHVDGGGALKTDGYLILSGGLKYQKENRSLYLTNPDLASFKLYKLPRTLMQAIKEVSQAALKESLKDRPIYTIKQDEADKDWAKRQLKSVMIKDQKLLLELELFE